MSYIGNQSSRIVYTNLNKFKGTVADLTELEAVTGASSGDMYKVEDSGHAHMYDGTQWVDMGPIVGPQGVKGTGITSVVRTSGDGSEGTVDTYTITYDDTSTSTFEVRNGTAGTINHIAKTDTVGRTDTYTVYADAAETQPLGTFEVYNGVDSEAEGLGTAAARDVGTSDGQLPEFVSNGKGLGGFGYGRVGTSVGQYADVNDVPKRTGFYLLTDGHPNSTNNKAPLAGFYDTAILRTLRQSTNDFVDVYLPYHQYSNGMVIAPHTSSGYAPQRIVTDSVNLRTSTGNSTIYPMSQKAVTDALDTKAGTTTQVIAGTGLSGGGDLTADRTLSVNYGTVEGTAAQGNDYRITGAMQKSANLSDLVDVAIARTNLGLGSVEEGAQVNIPTNLNYTAATRVLASSTGEDVTLPQVTALADGLMIASDKGKLDDIEANAKDDQTASEVPVVSTGNLKSTNVQSALEELQLDVDTINDDLETKVDKVVGQGLSDSNYTQAEKDKLAGLDSALLTKFDKTSVVQSTGQSAEKVMSQKVVTDIIANIPSVPRTYAYTVVAADKGKSIDTTSNVTIPASVFTAGDVIVVTNTSATDSSILAASGVTIRLAGSTKTGTLTLAGYGVATLRMVTSNNWFASGAGLK